MNRPDGGLMPASPSKRSPCSLRAAIAANRTPFEAALASVTQALDPESRASAIVNVQTVHDSEVADLRNQVKTLTRELQRIFENGSD